MPSWRSIPLLLLYLGLVIAMLTGMGQMPIETPKTPTVTAEQIQLPSAEAFSPELSRRLKAALPEAKGPYINRLALEKSPYLRQHAENPVNWMPWSEEAFARAKELHRPVLVSIGYATCHWCHVMEKESFEDVELAGFINRHFVAIKVDREERPDVDALYMSATLLMNRSGGWPMTVVLTPEKLPFFAGTYFPARTGDRGQQPGFLNLLVTLSQAWEDEPERIQETGALLLSNLKKLEEDAKLVGPLSNQPLHAAYKRLSALYDREWGGFGRAPKFPQPSQLGFLLRYSRQFGAPDAEAMVENTFDHMLRGGIYDQVGGGFARYATDRLWHVPHFEKMLYDNAQLLSLSVELWQKTRKRRFLEASKDIYRYLVRDMQSPKGGFYAATDADSEGKEGSFYLWTPSELKAVLGSKGAHFVVNRFKLSPEGNFEGKNILYSDESPAEAAKRMKMRPKAMRETWSELREKLYEARNKREKPLLDDKILAGWNGQVIAALASFGAATGNEEALKKASQAADFVLSAMRNEKGQLYRAYRDNSAFTEGVLEDYAFMIDGLLRLFEATQKGRWLQAAIQLQAVQDADFWDRVDHGYFQRSSRVPALLLRQKPRVDGAEPSGNSVAALNLLRLYRLTDEIRYYRQAEQLLRVMSGMLDHGASGGSKMASALDSFHDRGWQIVLVGSELPGARALSKMIQRSFLPHAIRLELPESPPKALLKQLPWLEGKTIMKKKPTVYICESGRCLKPVTGPKGLQKQLEALEKASASLSPKASR